MTQPLISVVIPFWNEEKRIARAIKCIQDQTYTNLEIIIVDDGATDTSRSIAEEIAKNDPRITVLSCPINSGARKNWRGYDINSGCVARAYGFSIAKGEWITTQDADDSSLLNRIEVQYNLALRHNATMVCVEWQQPLEKVAGKKLNVDLLFREKGEDAFLVRPDVITPLSNENLGLLMRLPFHRFIPFPFKWFPYTRTLFYGKQTMFIGADNSMLFHRKVIEQGVNFRRRNERQWGVPSGRGSGRDFVMNVTYTFKNTWTLRLPLYLWDVRTPNPTTPTYENYLIT